jgi:hypothetical protein
MGMERRTYRGQEFVVPDAAGVEVVCERARYRKLIDGLGACLAICPIDNRNLKRDLQYAWMECRMAMEKLEKPVETESFVWPT